MIINNGDDESSSQYVIEELAEARARIKRQEKDIENLKKIIGKICGHTESIVKEINKLNVGARSDKD